MNIVKISADSLTLSSGLSQDSFARTNTSSLLKEKCTIVKIDNEKITCESYQFDTTEADKNQVVRFKGKAFEGILLSELLSKQGADFSETDIFSLASFCAAVDFLSGREDFSGTVGAGGIIINADSKNKTAEILFIAGELFEECAYHHKELYPQLQGKFLYKGLDYPYSLYFMCAVVMYKALTNHFPFTDDDTTKRQEDIFDENFIPIRLWKPKIHDGFAENIESSLKLKVNQEIKAGKRALSNTKTDKKREKTLKKLKEFNTADDYQNKLQQALQAAPHDTALESKRNSFIKKQEKKLSAKRFLRRNKNRIFAGIAVIFVLIWFVSGYVEQNSKLVTTKGLTSTQTTAVLYTMMHRADVPNLQEVVTGKETKDLLIKISTMYVGTKQRLETSPDNGTLPPSQWFFYKKEQKNWMFGITNLKIDGVSFAIENNYAIKKDKPAQIYEESGTILKKGDESTHMSEYYFVRQLENRISIEKMNDTVTLRWNGKQWKIIKIDGKAKIQSIKSKDFIEEYYTMLGKTDRKTALETLAQNYEWIPDETDLKDAARFLSQKYGSGEAQNFLESAEKTN